MRVATHFVLSLAILLSVLLLFAPAALASTSDCPAEPVSGTLIGDGEIYIGPDCTLYSPGDVDSFVFNAVSGQTFHMILAINGSAPTNICVRLYDPNAMQVASSCTNVPYNYAAGFDKNLVVTGTYTMVVTETSSATISYALALHRLYPFPANAQQVNLGVLTDGDIDPITDSDAFTFYAATTGTYQVSATLPGSANANLCMYVYAPDGTLFNSVCTNVPYTYTITIVYPPTQDGTTMAFFQVAGNHGTASYTMEASCLVGNCPVLPQTFTVLHSFGWSEGGNPKAGLVQATDGNLYGTTVNGGYHNGGTVFKITPSGTLTTLYSFCSQIGCTDGLAPQAGLIQSSDGNLYGTTSSGGVYNFGTVFKITTAGMLTTVYNFTSTDGSPQAGLVEGSDGSFYGTTYAGGSRDRGTAFKVTPAGHLTRLHSFCSLNGCADGAFPQAGLVLASDGNFYGTTFGGGLHNRGTVFKMTAVGALTTLYSFNLTDGVGPAAGLIQASDGNFYGTTYGGGAHAWGSVFKITPGGMLNTLYSFAFKDGANPSAGLIQGNDGNLYGTTQMGGAKVRGTIFQLTLGGTLTTLQSVSSPQGAMIQASDGNLYGTTFAGGPHDFGTVFKVVPGQ